MAKEFVLQGEQRKGVVLALAALIRMPGGGRGWNERLYRNGITDCEWTLMRLLGSTDAEAIDPELKALSRIERGAAKRAANGDT